MNGLNSIFRVLTSTIRSTAGFTIGTGITFALCHELDDILVTEGKEPYFVPGMKSMIVNAGLEGQVRSTLKRLGFKDAEPRSINNMILNMTPEEKLKYQQETGQSWESLIQSRKSLQENLNNPTEKKNITQEIKSFIDKEEPFKKQK